MTGTPWPSGESEEDIMCRLSPPVPTKSRTTRRCRHIITPDTYMWICGAPHIRSRAISLFSFSMASPRADYLKVLSHQGASMIGTPRIMPCSPQPSAMSERQVCLAADRGRQDGSDAGAAHTAHRGNGFDPVLPTRPRHRLPLAALTVAADVPRRPMGCGLAASEEMPA